MQSTRTEAHASTFQGDDRGTCLPDTMVDMTTAENEDELSRPGGRGRGAGRAGGATDRIAREILKRIRAAGFLRDFALVDATIERAFKEKNPC